MIKKIFFNVFLFLSLFCSETADLVKKFTDYERTVDSYDKIFGRQLDKRVLEAVESKLFGVGIESFTAGSHEFYQGLAQKYDKVLCLDMGHFHPTEQVSDKLSAVLLYVNSVLLHLSRGVR